MGEGTCWGAFCVVLVWGGVLFSHTLSGAVPSPLWGLASRFGMGLGVSSTLGPPQKGSTIILFVPFTLPPAWFPVFVGFPGFVGGFGLVVDRIVVVSFGYVCFCSPLLFPPC